MQALGIRFLFFSIASVFSSFAKAEPKHVELRRLPDSIATAAKYLNPAYVVASPAANKPTEKTPLLIFLHGSGDRGTDLTKLRSAAPH